MRFSQQLRVDDFALDASAEVPEGRITGLLGHSGAGKSTLLHCLCGLKRAAGAVHIQGRTLQDDGAGLWLAPEKRRIGYIPQQAGLFSHLTVRGNLEYALRRNPEAEGTSGFSLPRVTELLGITPLLQRRPTGLSGGEQRRVTIARALLSQPQLLLLDEPLTGLHGRAREQLSTALFELLRTTALTAIWVSHDLGELARVADHLLSMQDGRIVHSGVVNAVLCDTGSPFGADLGAVLDVQVTGHEDALTLARVQKATLRLPGTRFSPGQSLRLHIPADAVSLARSRASDSSILNILAARVTEIGQAQDGQCLVRLDSEAGPLLARLSAHSVSLLQLDTGQDVYAQIKGVALVRRTPD